MRSQIDQMNEEVTSLKPRGPGSPYSTGPNSFQMSREKRLERVRLGLCYYVLWTLLVLTASLIPFYQWFFIEEPYCWSFRYGHIMLSVFFSMLTALVSLLLCLLNCLSRGSISIWRLNFCTLCFIILVLLAIINFLTGVYFFSLSTCYFANVIPSGKLTDESNIFEIITLKYDLKIVAVFHLVCSLLSFTIGIGFAIIKNNFKYIRQIDFD